VTVSTDGPQIVGLSRLGLNHSPTVIVLTFNQPLDAASAQNSANYELFNAATGHRYALANVLYDPATLTVSIVPWQPLPVQGKYILEVIGTGPNAVTNANGLALDGTGSGQPGSNFVTKFNWHALSAPGRSPAVVYNNGQAVDTYTGRFITYYNAIAATTQYYIHHAASLGWTLPLATTRSQADLRSTAHLRIDLDQVPEVVTKKLVTTRMELPKVTKHKFGQR
jgi:hypothetical protein